MIPFQSPLIKTIWRELYYRPRWYADSHAELERLFSWSEDPWNFQSSRYERDRLQALFHMVQRYPHDVILEVGCGEGAFTQELEKIAKHIVAIDVSPTALERAKRRCQATTFVNVSIEDFEWDGRFDMVICAETLYYISNVQVVLEKLKSLARFGLVSYVQRESRTLNPYVLQMPLIEFTQYQKSYWFWKRVMTMALWESNGSTHKHRHLLNENLSLPLTGDPFA